ncbi:serine/threonine protein phosphatase [Nocardia yunnanensis]|uniref:Serine/threonine protein phosphatase n=1 Tax=Nocardia yunnanensis TaxID=2382165 RepID=A0A386ZLT6_9NOCA|nr:serine/threonine protein phosphatase [Nocardia yunnanensis]
MRSLWNSGRHNPAGVGGDSAILDVDGTPVFAKRIPLTDKELTSPGNTANLFDLPMFHQYGTGGPSFNAWRELAANITVTQGILSGETAAFPMLFHWRVLPGRPAVAPEHADIEAVFANSNGSPAVRSRLKALAAATSSLTLFSEYIPHPMSKWLHDNPIAKAATTERHLAEIVTFLNTRALLHMDAHFDNLRTDGNRLYLTDFGLATSPTFDLSPTERAFTIYHATYDADYLAMRLVNWLVTALCGIPIPPTGTPTARNDYVLRCATGDIPTAAPPDIVPILLRHAPTAAKMNPFWESAFLGDTRAVYPG